VLNLCPGSKEPEAFHVDRVRGYLEGISAPRQAGDRRRCGASKVDICTFDWYKQHNRCRGK